MLFSAATGYALRAMAALPEDGSYSLAKDLASELDLPGPYLAKILQALAKEGLLTSIRGPRGGFRLALPASDITMGEIVRAMDGEDTMAGCVMGLTRCDGRDQPCPLHAGWQEVKTRMEQTMAEVTIRDLKAMNLNHRS